MQKSKVVLKLNNQENKKTRLKNEQNTGRLVAQWVEHPTPAQAMISRFVSSSPALGSALTARRPEPASDSVCPSLSLHL